MKLTIAAISAIIILITFVVLSTTTSKIDNDYIAKTYNSLNVTHAYLMSGEIEMSSGEKFVVDNAELLWGCSNSDYDFTVIQFKNIFGITRLSIVK